MTTTRFVRACRGEPVDRIPIWMMRQAGRYMKVYRDLKESVGGFLALCQNPEACAKATLDAAEYLETDAAIIFSDITMPAMGMGMPLEFAPGPKFSSPIRDMDAVGALKPLQPEKDLGYVMEAIRITRKRLPEDVALIGFVGAPITLGAYMIEGYPSKSWGEFKQRLYGDADFMHALLEKVADGVAAHARAQIEAGADAIQLFDTNAGDLMPAELETFAFGYAKRVMDKLQDLNVPIIYFAKGIGAHLEKAAALGNHVVGVDWTVDLSEARKRVPDTIALQGNLDPTVLFTNPDEIRKRVNHVLDQVKDRPGYIFNLGHGILKETPPEHAKIVVETVHAYKL